MWNTHYSNCKLWSQKASSEGVQEAHDWEESKGLFEVEFVCRLLLMKDPRRTPILGTCEGFPWPTCQIAV